MDNMIDDWYKSVPRPCWDDYFMDMANLVAERATCLRRKVGAIAVRDKRILATGYNGPPSGLRHCDETGCMREQLGIPSGQRHELCRAVHAEQNVIIQAALHGIPLKDATMYITLPPCVICAKMIINAGIKRIVFDGYYNDLLSTQMLTEAGVRMDIRQITNGYKE